MQKIIPFLWFDNQAEEAANFYISLFKNSRMGNVSRGPNGEAFMVTFQLESQQYMALNGGPRFKFTEAVSFYVNCETQAEVDELWDRLTADGGEESQCGWLKDKYGLWWQIIPTILGELMQDEDAEKASRVTQAMLQMNKIDIATLLRAREQL
ncbi:MAG: VOC family protein [Anaerolineae bacterium]|nr:VOC family protein [Anaerolineae bacterium]